MPSDPTTASVGEQKRGLRTRFTASRQSGQGAMRRAGRLESDEDLQALGYYSAVSLSQRRVKNGLVVAALVVIWYLCAVVTITTTKEIMNRVHFPFLLSSIQFSFAAAFSALYLHATKSFVHVPTNVSSLVRYISFSYTLGFIFTNSAFSLVTAAFAETIKSSEPISTVLIGLIFLNEGASLRTYLTLLPICVGVAISCYNNDSFNMLGFVFAAASNLCFSGRAVLAKKLSLSYPDAMDEINLFLNISLDGLMLLVPTTLVFESRSLYHFLRADLTQTQAQTAGLGWLLLANGSMFAVYNLVSYLVLRRTDLITHSVLNAFRRVFIILFTTFYFSNHLSSLNCLGIAVAIAGVVLFGYFRSRDKAK